MIDKCILVVEHYRLSLILFIVLNEKTVIFRLKLMPCAAFKYTYVAYKFE